jgi:hypothetical protein
MGTKTFGAEATRGRSETLLNESHMIAQGNKELPSAVSCFYLVTRMIIEMRTYKTKPGRRSEFLEIFRSKSIPAHKEIGMKILGPFVSVEDPDTFFFMRGFPDLASREPMKAKFYEGELWKSELENTLMPMLENYEAVLVDDPEHLVKW